MRNKNVQIMVETAVLVGAALLLSELRLWRAAQGGSITLEIDVYKRQPSGSTRICGAPKK